MGSILTFAEEYRDKSWDQMPFCIVDSLILSQLAYYDYSGVGTVENGEKAAIPGFDFGGNVFRDKLCDYYEAMSARKREIVIPGMVTAPEDLKLIPVLKKGGRHGSLRACRYAEEFSVESGKQFAAITVEIVPGEYYIAFRGTDTSIVGWKEDSALSFSESVPAQEAALRYTRETMLRFRGRFYIGGHSKGGNLAVYAAMNLPENLQERVQKVYNFDGPGFLEGVYASSNFENIRGRICKLIPQSAVVGQLLEEYAEYRVVRSSADGPLQHNPFSWKVNEADFVYLNSEDIFSQLFKRSMDGWLEELSYGERKQVFDTFFGVITDTGVNTFYELTDQRMAKIRALLENVSKMEPEDRKRLQTAVKRFLSIALEEIRAAAKEEGAAQLGKNMAKLEKYAAWWLSRIKKNEESAPDVKKSLPDQKE